MPKDDYDRIVFLILRILFVAFQEGRETKPEEIDASYFEINEGYWLNIIREMKSKGWIDGVSIERDIHCYR